MLERPPERTKTGTIPPFRPQPRTVEETGIEFGVHVDLCLKTLRNGGRLSGGEIARRLKLSYTVAEMAIAFLKREKMVEVVGSLGVTEQQYEYALSDKGYEKASEALDRNQYVGPLPVTLADYVNVVSHQSVRDLIVTPASVNEALSDLELSPAVRRLIGAAVNGGHSILLYGKPGNGKTSIAKRIAKMLNGAVLIPYAIDIGGQTLRVYDPRVHSAFADGPDDHRDRRVQEVPIDSKERRRDQRWVVANRPLISVGGELTIDDLDLKYSPVGKFYLAPIQILANGGILVIDDFGRQRMRPDELLNRWIIPMEEGIDHYSMLSGETIAVPFELLLVFSTNLSPEKLGDEAFWRRIRHKVEIGDPSDRIFLQILETICAENSIEYSNDGARYLLDTHYLARGRPFRAVHPRDLIGLIMDMGGFEGVHPELTPEWLDAAAASYFIEDDAS